MDEEQDAGVAQLREVFDACDRKRRGRLDAEGLRLLCQRLQLEHRAPLLVRHLLGPGRDSRTTVSFEEFKDGFISLLTQAEEVALESSFSSACPIAENEPCKQAEETDEIAGGREISPKFVLGEKKYGRRSRPVSQADMDVELSSEGDSCTDDVLSSGDDSAAIGRPSKRTTAPTTRYSVPPPDDSAPVTTSSPSDRKDAAPKADAVSTASEASPALGSGSEIFLSPCNASGNGSESAESSLTLLETNPEAYLHGIWKKLDVGRDGFLNVDELAGVCEHIGMEMNDETICQLFDTLDCDRDGKISFEEFLQGMFQHGHSGSTGTPVPFNVASPLPPPPADESAVGSAGTLPSRDSSEHRQFGRYQVSRRHPAGFKDTSVADEPMSEKAGTVAPAWESGIFSSIDPDNTGYADSQTIVSFWESLGLSGGSTMLKQLGFNPNLKVSLVDLTTQLEEELMSVTTAGSTYRFALASYQHELQHLKMNFEQAREERNRLRVNIAEANARATLLAQEVDEHHAKLEKASENKLVTMEKRHQEQIREAQEELQRERESGTVQLSKLRQQCQEEVTSLRNEENKLRIQLATLQQDNHRLESELQDVSEKCRELHRLSENQQKELESVAHLKQRIADLESGQAFLKDEQCQKMIFELEAARKQNKEIQDSNDELSLELETLRQQLATSGRHSKRHRRSGSWLAEYARPGAASAGGLKRRGSDGSSSEESDEDNPVAEKIRKRAAFMLNDLEDTHIPLSLLEAENLSDSQREAFDRLRAAYERTLRDMEDICRRKVAEMESQLSTQLSQPEVDKDSMDAAQSVISKLQEELDLKNVLIERLRADVTTLQSHVTQQREQLEAQLTVKEQEYAQMRAATEDELRRVKEEMERKEEDLLEASKVVEALKERLRESDNEVASAREREVEWREKLAKREREVEARRKEAGALEAVKRRLEEEVRGMGKEVKELRTLLSDPSVREEQQRAYEMKLAEVRSQVELDLVQKVRTDVERELQMSLERNLTIHQPWQDGDRTRKPEQMTAQLTEDICALLRVCFRCGGKASEGSGDSLARAGCLQEKLAGLIGKTLTAIEAHLETLHLQEQERLKQSWEDEVRRLKQDHMIQCLEAELQHKQELSRLTQEWPSVNPNPGMETGSPSKTDALLRDLYVENARLLRTLQAAEDGRRRAEHNSTRLQYKCKMLSQLLTDVTRASVSGGGGRVACA